EGDLHVFREAMETEKPRALLDAIEGRVPFDRFVDAGDGALDDFVEAPPERAFPPRHCGDISLNRLIAIALGNLRVAAGEQHHFVGLRLLRLPPGRGPAGRLLAWLLCHPLLLLDDAPTAPSYGMGQHEHIEPLGSAIVGLLI